MANQIPLAEGVDAAGGYLVRDTYGATLQLGILRQSVMLDLCRVDRVPGKRQRYTVYAGRPTAGFVAEGASKPVTGAEFTELVINTKKIASIVVYTEEMLEDAVEDPQLLIAPDVEGAIANLIDQHALGYTAGSAIVGQFDAEATGSTSTVELGAGADALAIAVSSAMATIEGNGYTPNGIVLAQDLRQNLRDARSSFDTTMPVFSSGDGVGRFGREPDSLYGMPIRYTEHLDALPAAAGKVAAIVGDFRQAIFTLRKDVVFRKSTDATVGGNSMFEQNKVACLWETRLGFNIFDINRSFVTITNAA